MNFTGLFLLSSKCYVIPLGVSQLQDLEIPERWRHFHIQLRLGQTFFVNWFTTKPT